MSRKKVDLTTLPNWSQYFISLVVVAIVVSAAWFVGRNQPIPDWVEAYLVPWLGWAFIFILTYAVASRIVQK